MTTIAAPAYLDPALVSPTEFDWRRYVAHRLGADYAQLGEDQRSIRRVAACRYDPLLFGLLYFADDLTFEEQITFADMHFDLCRIARHLMKPPNLLDTLRLAVIAPRNSGKSTWLFKVISVWLLAFGHKSFVGYLAASDAQATRWMGNFKRTIDQNRMLKFDFAQLCVPAKRESTGHAFNDNQNVYAAESGAKVGAFGIDSKVLGLNVDGDRPDILIFDDIEPHGGGYTPHQMSKVLTGVLEGAVPMAQPGSPVIFIGTVNMPGSIMDQLREHGVKPDPKSWVGEQGFRVRHYKPFVDLPDGRRRSFWPARWSYEYLVGIAHTRFFASVFENQPLPEMGAYWRDGDITYGTIAPSVPVVTVLSVDPAVSTKKKSDFTALAIIRYAPSINRFEVIYGRAFKLNPGVEMPQRVAEIVALYPEIVAIIIEDNQGKDLWQAHYGSIPGVQLWQTANTRETGSKTQRAALVLRMYQTGHVTHSEPLVELERELYAFPNGLHDDLPDAVSTGVLTLLAKYGNPQVDSESMYVQ